MRHGASSAPWTKRSARRSSSRCTIRLRPPGFEHYEVSNYALPGFRARHNASYWHGTKYLGIGPAAHSFDGEERHWNASSVEKYIAGAPAGKEVLTRRDRFNEYVMTALRTVEGIDLEEAAARFGAKRLARMQEEAHRSSVRVRSA